MTEGSIYRIAQVNGLYSSQALHVVSVWSGPPGHPLEPELIVPICSVTPKLVPHTLIPKCTLCETQNGKYVV